MRAAYKQKDIFPGWTRFLDLTSQWGDFNGLRSIIPKSLIFTVSGYPWIMSDMIGGNVGGVLTSLQVPEEELYIRWTQLAFFLPTVQFSLTPWELPYSKNVTDNAKNMQLLRNKFVTPILLKFQNDKSLLGTPDHGFPVTPLWFIDHSDIAFQSQNQYLVGTEILVAPVDEQGQRSRNVYIPGEASMEWARIDIGTGEVTDETFPGGTVLVEFPMDLLEVGLFARVR